MANTRALTSILADSGEAREVAPGLYTTLHAETAPAPYDRKAVVYDAVVGRSIYHRIFWGTSATAYTRFGRAALDAAGDGLFAEVGCGSLLFTARMYRDTPGISTLLVDRSIEMLGRALGRIRSDPTQHPDGVVALHADATALPLRSAIFSAILSLNLFHVPCDRAGLAAEWARTLLPGRGRLFVSSLVRVGRWSDAYMSALQRVGELGPPLALDELRETIAGRWGAIESTTVEGNMCFLVVRHAG
jgi:SAM-dependent methyltransferase